MRKYSLEYKKQVLKDYFDGVDGIRGLGRKYGIDHQLIVGWVKRSNDPEKKYQLGAKAKEVCLKLKDPPQFNSRDNELEYLRTENAYLKEMLHLCGYQKTGRKKKDSKQSQESQNGDSR